jgi:hypothetical protein
MPLNITPVHRNLHTRVTILYLEFEDLFLILFGRFLHRELCGPLNILFRYIVPIATIPVLIACKYGKPRRYLVDFLEWHSKPQIYCGMEPDGQQTIEYLREEQTPCQ